VLLCKEAFEKVDRFTVFFVLIYLASLEMPGEKTGGLRGVGAGMSAIPFAELAKDVHSLFRWIDGFMNFFPVWRCLLSFESKTEFGILFL